MNSQNRMLIVEIPELTVTVVMPVKRIILERHRKVACDSSQTERQIIRKIKTRNEHRSVWKISMRGFYLYICKVRV